MLNSLYGRLAAYGLRDVLAQGYEKLILDPRRLRRVREGEPLYPPAPAYRPPACPPLPLTVFLVCRSFYPETSGGTEGFTLRLARQLMTMGCRVLVFAHAAWPADQFDRQLCGVLYWRGQVEGVSVVRLRDRAPLRGLLKGFPPDPDITAFAKAVFAWEKPDVVHFTHLARLHGFAQACQQIGIPYLVTLTDFFGVCHYSTRIDRYGAICPGSGRGVRCSAVCPTCQVEDPAVRRDAATHLLLGAALVTAPSSYVAGIFTREFSGLDVKIIPHGIDLSPGTLRPDVPARHFGYVGRLDEAKGTGLLVRAFRAMPPDCTLEFYGDGPAAHRLRRMAMSDPRIMFRGAISPERLAAVYRSLDCVVVPSLVPETYNFVSREALQSGCIVIASASGALAEVVGASPAGLLFCPGDQNALLAAMRRVYTMRTTGASRVAPTCAEEARAYHDSYILALQGG